MLCWAVMCRWNGAELDYNQDDARQTVVNWIDGTAGISSAFDFPTKGILQVGSCCFRGTPRLSVTLDSRHFSTLELLLCAQV